MTRLTASDFIVALEGFRPGLSKIKLDFNVPISLGLVISGIWGVSHMTTFLGLPASKD